ncbi:MAG TPA: type II/IV secretion system ATPase subunit, partial [Methanomassiliicoccales archaeon]|nr:type II/IV secretion system ATPase subunit [Methanomassiliicoccales archaeon]
QDPDVLRGYVHDLAYRTFSDEREKVRSIGQPNERLAQAVVRYTIGLGLLEHFLLDDRVEDVYMDAPGAENRWHVVLSGIGERSTVRAETNIFGSDLEAAGLVSRLRQHSLKPFSEAIPVLETDVPGYDARATVMGPPLSPHGHALAFRRHSRRPWTLLRLVRQGALSVSSAALLSFLIDGRSSMLVCGPRGAGKSSLLAALLFEFHPNQRIVTIEDTLELPVRQMQQLGYKAQSILVRPGLDRSVDESADEALRVSLRLGESALVMGEVRGREARTLFESMRTGKAGSSVLGTVHGESARSVFERTVHDLGVAPEAFCATDLVITLGLIRWQGSQRQERKVTELAEVRKDSTPGGFEQMMADIQDLEGLADRPHFHLIERVANGWGMSYDDAVRNIVLRAGLRNILLEAQERTDKDLMGPEMVRACNEHLWAWTEERHGDDKKFLDRFRALVQEMV